MALTNGIQKQFAKLGVPSPFSSGHIRNVDHFAFRKAMLAGDMSVVGGGGGGGVGGGGGASHFASWCSLSGCQALHLFAVICTAGQG